MLVVQAGSVVPLISAAVHLWLNQNGPSSLEKRAEKTQQTGNSEAKITMTDKNGEWPISKLLPINLGKTMTYTGETHLFTLNNLFKFAFDSLSRDVCHFLLFASIRCLMMGHYRFKRSCRTKGQEAAAAGFLSLLIFCKYSKNSEMRAKDLCQCQCHTGGCDVKSLGRKICFKVADVYLAPFYPYYYP